MTSLLSPAREVEPRAEGFGPGSTRGSPARIVIWDLENCAVPLCYRKDLAKLVRALKSDSQACRVVTAAAVPPTDPGAADQLQAMSDCDVEVLSFTRPRHASSSAKKYNCADYVLKRVSSQITKMKSEKSSKWVTIIGICKFLET